MLQVRFNGADVAMSKLAPDRQRSIGAEFQAVQQLPGVIDANRLQPVATATTVRIDNGHTRVTNEIAVAPAAALDGYYLCDAPDLQAAIDLATRIPAIRFGATIEIRPTVER